MWIELTGAIEHMLETPGALAIHGYAPNGKSKASCKFSRATPVPSCANNECDGYAVEGALCGPADCDDANLAMHRGEIEICNTVDATSQALQEHDDEALEHRHEEAKRERREHRRYEGNEDHDEDYDHEPEGGKSRRSHRVLSERD